MPDMQAALRTRIISAGTSAGSRVDWVSRPQLAALPAITMQVLSDERPQHLKGIDGARGTRVQVDCWASTYAAALGLARACIAALYPPATVAGKRFANARVDGQRDLGEDVNGTFVHRQSIDFLVWHVGD